MERVAARTLALASSPAPDWAALELMVKRLRELGLPEEWWAVQNLIWDKQLHRGEGRTFAALLGFAV